MEPQLCAMVTVGSDEAIEEMLRAAFPQFVTWMVWLAEVFALTFPKFTLNVSKQTAGAGTDKSILAMNEWIGDESGLAGGGSWGWKLPEVVGKFAEFVVPATTR